jgi:precorrin-6B methylase 2
MFTQPAIERNERRILLLQSNRNACRLSTFSVLNFDRAAEVIQSTSVNMPR